jgi:quinol-cytochrome oxidoreductase complex cytochrome b subunit
MLLVPGALIGLITLHLWLVIKNGVTPPPWAKTAAGYEPPPRGPTRRGLVEPRPRGTNH